ncbi:hypothetical protein PRIPAC_72842 [Pristionchus pacificus]|uniref:Solute carrier organic anion transporter family member n=1 Tax=Pristionchus pacificus TaxID=54126 RepID=A0A2A6B4Q8_PRIPA|nr:hypothetical protein PRIPAC_72842 [Pristionchus pacificus]|eukprot:PDM60854.1 membrane transporter [Pristionchus pacificus]
MELEDSETIACLVSLTALAMQQPQPICTCVACLFDSEPSAPPSHSFDPSSIPIVYMGAHPPSLFLLNSIQIPFSMFSMCQHDEWGARECDITESDNFTITFSRMRSPPLQHRTEEDRREGEDAGAETRSAPGDLMEQYEDSDLDRPSTSANRRRERFQKHSRNKPGFTSGPPWPRPVHTEAPWAQQVPTQHQELIEKEINHLAAETQCGIGKWRVPAHKKFDDAVKHKMLEGLIVNGLVPSSISTIERRFKLSTSTIGRIMQFYDFGYVLFCIPVSYFGGRHSKPVVLAIGLAVMLTGSFVFSWPHLFAESYSADDDERNYGKCLAEGGPASALLAVANGLEGGSNMTMAQAEALRDCKSDYQPKSALRYVLMFCFAHFLHGIGATPLFTIGVSFIDENVGPALSSLFIGIFYAFAIFGPALGFLAASRFLQLHTDFMHMPPEQWARMMGIEETDPRWVGAWWLGFQVVCVLGALGVFPLLILPKVLPESLKWHRTRLREETLTGPKKRSPECCGMPATAKTAAINGSAAMLHVDEKAASHALADTMPSVKHKGPLWYQLWLDVRHIPIAIYRILTNGSYMLITLAVAVDGLVVTGASSFMSKYLERQFSVAPSKANVLIGCIMVPMAGVGTMLSGFIVQHFRLSCVKTLKFSIGLLLMSLLLTPMYLIYCDHDPLVGMEKHYPGSSDETASMLDSSHLPTLYSQCNSGCDCVETEYHPVCAELSDGTQMSFYSPCFAGCPEQYHPLKKTYNNCSCVPPETKKGFKLVKRGFCESKCTGLFGFLVLFAPLAFCTFAVGVPLIVVVLRTVDYAERSFALGIQWILVRVIGTIPAPVLFGWMFDVSCTHSQKDACSGEEGSCMLYNNKRLADLFLAFSIVGQTIAMILLVCVLLFFAGTMRDDPMPDAAVIPPDEENGGEDGDKEEAQKDEKETIALELHPLATETTALTAVST